MIEIYITNVTTTALLPDTLDADGTLLELTDEKGLLDDSPVVGRLFPKAVVGPVNPGVTTLSDDDAGGPLPNCGRP